MVNREPYKSGGRSSHTQTAQASLTRSSHPGHYHPYSTIYTMSTSQAAASFYSASVMSSEIPVFDPELQRLVEELDHLNTADILDYLPCGASEQGDVFEGIMLTADESYLSLYDLCGGDPTLVDTIKREYSGSFIGSSTTTTPSLVATAPSPAVGDSGFPAPTVGGKWVPSFHPGLVRSSLRYAPTPRTPFAVPTLRPATPATPYPAPETVSRSAGPSRRRRAATNTRTQPYRKAAPAPRKARVSDKHKGRIGRMETRDYLDAYPARAEDITPPQGYKELIRAGRWSPIIVDALMQISVPYPMVALQKLLSELYDGEGEQEGMPKGAEGKPLYPWRVSFSSFLPACTVSDDTDFIGVALLACVCQ